MLRQQMCSSPLCAGGCPSIWGCGRGGKRRHAGEPHIGKPLIPVFPLQKSSVPRRLSVLGGVLRATGHAAPLPAARPVSPRSPRRDPKEETQRVGGAGGNVGSPAAKLAARPGGTAVCARLRSGAEPPRPRRRSAPSPPAGAGRHPAAAGPESPREPRGRCAWYEGVPSAQGSGSASRRGEGQRDSGSGLRLGGEERPTG